jgi:hypothetical protein
MSTRTKLKKTSIRFITVHLQKLQNFLSVQTLCKYCWLLRWLYERFRTSFVDYIVNCLRVDMNSVVNTCDSCPVQRKRNVWLIQRPPRSTGRVWITYTRKMIVPQFTEPLIFNVTRLLWQSSRHRWWRLKNITAKLGYDPSTLYFPSQNNMAYHNSVWASSLYNATHSGLELHHFTPLWLRTRSAAYIWIRKLLSGNI